MENKMITQLRAHCDSITNGSNKMTAQEKETLLILIKKSVSPSIGLTMATNEEEATAARSFENTPDEMMDESSEKLSSICASVALAFSELIEASLTDTMAKHNITDIDDLKEFDSSIKESLSAMSSTFNLPPDIAFKPVLLGSFIISQIEDPMEAVLQISNCLSVGESIIEHASQIAIHNLRLKQMLRSK
jgi:hypothetical protein